MASKKKTKKNQDKIYQISYPIKYFDVWDLKIEVIAKKFGLEESGSGAGFGERDIDYTAPNEEAFEKFLRACEKAGLKICNNT